MIVDGVVLIFAYLLGAVPFGLVLTRIAGLGDIREIGSGNIGATNVLRTGRKDLALLTLLLDSGKGAIAVLITGYYATLGDGPSLFGATIYPVVAGAVAFLGHCFPVWLAFKGGKGVATFFGTLIAISPFIALISGITWALMALIFRMSSLAGLSAALAAPLAMASVGRAEHWPYVGFMTLLIFWRHKENISRLLKGTEPKIGAKKEADPS